MKRLDAWLFVAFVLAVVVGVVAGAINTGALRWIRNNSTSGNHLTIDPHAAETINGAATLTLADGESAHVVCNGTAWFTF